MITLSRRWYAAAAAVICGAGLAGVSATPAAADPPSASGGVSAQAMCYASSCSGLDPITTGCNAVATTPRTAVSPPPVPITVELRYSPACRAVWAVIRGGIIGDRARVENTDGELRTKTQTAANQVVHTVMVNDANILGRACVRAEHTETLTCTGWY